MDRKEIFRIRLITLFLTFLVLIPSLLSGAEWTSFTSFKNVRKMRLIQSQIFAATSGGIIILSDPTARGIELTNLDGLGTTDIFDIISDNSSQLWVAGDSRLVRFGGPNPRQFLFFDNNDDLFSPLTIADDGDYLWVGTEIGLILFSKLTDDGQIQDSYQLFSNLNPSPLVTDVLIIGDSIWLASSSGLAVANKTNFTALKDRNNWTTFSVLSNPELGTDTVLQVAAFEGEMYIGTTRGLFRLDRNPADTTFTQLSAGSITNVTDMHIDNDSLFIYNSAGLSALKSGVVNSIATTGLPSSPVAGINDGILRWVGVAGGGIYSSSGGSFSEYAFTGLPDNDITDVVIGLTGQLSILFIAGPAATLQTDSSWKEHQFTVGDRGISIITDSSGILWSGVWGPGIWSIDDTILTQYTDVAGSPTSLDGVADNVVVTFGLYADKNYLYATSFLARNGNPLSIARLSNIDAPSGWTSFGQSDGIIDNWIVSLDVFDGSVAIGSGVAGVFICYVGPDPFDKSDDFCTQFVEGFNNGNLISNTVRIVKYSPDGVLWVGTNFGISRFDRGIDRFVDVQIPATVEFGPDITAIDFDSRGNVWIGARNGLARIDATSGEFSLMTDLNSDLVSSNVRSLTVDRRTNTLWVGTDRGLSRLLSQTGENTSIVDDIVPYPNPFIIKSSNDLLRFNSSKALSARIFTTAGELVAEFNVNQPWDGRNNSGRPCASGVYLYLVTDEDGNIGRGKFLLVREQ